MLQYPIYTGQNECRDCFKCANRCPVNAICVQDGCPDILPKMCIFCGKCVTHCPSGAKRVRNDVEQIKKVIQSGKKVFVSLAPSFPAEFCDCTSGQLIASLKKLGFYAVSETALGADFVSADIASGLRAASEKKDGQKLFLSSACPAVVLYIKRYAPAFVPYLNDRASPLLAHAALLQKMYGKEIRIVFIGPCIAKKREADQFTEIAAALTFNELKQWFKEEGIRPERIAEDEGANQSFVPRRAAKGSFYPVDGGMLISLRSHTGFSKTSNMVVSGIDTIAEMLNRDTSVYAGLESPLFLELLACQGGCVNGPCITKDASAISRRAKLLKYAESADDILDEETAGIKLNLSGSLTATERPQTEYSKGEIRVALSHIGKYSEKDELNCSICGYKTCRDFAVALLEKRVEKTMCVNYMRNMAQRKANALIKAMPGGIVIVDKECKVVECNRKFARLLGSEIEELFDIDPDLSGLDLYKVAGIGKYFEECFSMNMRESFNYEFKEGDKIFHLNIFVIEKGEILAGILEDITLPQIRRDKTVTRARRIIEKNVKTVQKIAFLLGENAAETESILHSIIESYTAGGKKK